MSIVGRIINVVMSPFVLGAVSYAGLYILSHGVDYITAYNLPSYIAAPLVISLFMIGVVITLFGVRLGLGMFNYGITGEMN